jgi:hypothetical protein
MAGRRKATNDGERRYLIEVLRADGVISGYAVRDESSRVVQTFRIAPHEKWPTGSAAP